MTDRIETLRAVAMAATPGPWAVDSESEHCLVHIEDGGEGSLTFDGFLMPQDATHAAAFNPKTALALLAVAQAAKSHMRAADEEDADGAFKSWDALRAALEELEKQK